VLVGADGIRSTVRECLLGDDRPRYAGLLAWRGLVPTATLPPDLIAPAATVWLGPRRHFVHYYVRAGELVNFVGVVETQDVREESWVTEGTRAELAADFAGWHRDVRTLIVAADRCFKWGLYERPPLPRWSFGRVTLLGDACHGMLPFLAQGAAMAIEDAWVLARLLQDDEEVPVEALLEYERFRRPRTQRVQLASAAQGRIFHLDSRAAVAARNLKLGLGSRLLPELAMQQFDWLHGYDAVRGFP